VGEKPEPREGEVALLIARGLSNKEVAHELGISSGNREDSHAQHFAEVGHKEPVQPRRPSGFSGRGLVELFFYDVWPGTHAVNLAKRSLSRDVPDTLTLALLCNEFSR
jgi:hypothetical protein